MTAQHARIVVVGNGVAGLSTALAAAPAKVLLLGRGCDGDGGASAMAQGGMAAAVGAGDSVEAHAEDTWAAGADHNDRAAVAWLTAAAPRTIEWLQQQGVAWDRVPGGQLELGREGGHRVARIVHAGGDATGAVLVAALRARVRTAGHIEALHGLDVDALLLRGGCVHGVRAHDALGRRTEIPAAATVLATGGVGALFARTSNPSGADGAGLALALAAGAAVRDLEFVQFHPTALATGDRPLPLLTEALRGAGAHLLDGQARPLMRGLHRLTDLAPRDVVARQVWLALRTDGQAWLDARAIEGDWQRRFPTVLAACLAHGLDPRRELLPVTPAAHFHMGGVATDLDGHTSLPGLFAVGEAACNGIHGANRLASNSLLEAVACGRRLGAVLARMGGDGGGHAGSTGHYRWIERGPGLDPDALAALQDLLWRAAGPVREGGELRAAWAVCRAAAERGWQMRLALALLRAARLRRVSLGAHYRQDRTCGT